MPKISKTKSVADEFTPILPRPSQDEILTAQRFIAREVYFFMNEDGEVVDAGHSSRVVNVARLYLSATDRWTREGFLWALHEFHLENLIRLRRAKNPFPADHFQNNAKQLAGLGFCVNNAEEHALGHFVVQTTDELRAYREQNPITTHELARLPANAKIVYYRQPDGYRGQLLMDLTTPLEFVYWLNETIFVQETMGRQAGALKHSSSGDLIHNAYILANEVKINGLGRPPSGECTLETELQELRFIKRHIREQHSVDTDRFGLENPEQERQLDALLGIHRPCKQQELVKPKKTRGRRRGSRVYNPKADKHAFEAHQANGNRYAATARALGMKEDEVRSAVERHRKRVTRN